MESTEIKTAANGTTQENSQPQPQSTAAAQLPEQLNQQQALQVLVDAARIAQSKGVFSLDDAELVNKAIKAFIPKGPMPSNS